jgi:hypothetical protein
VELRQGPAQCPNTMFVVAACITSAFVHHPLAHRVGLFQPAYSLQRSSFGEAVRAGTAVIASAPANTDTSPQQVDETPAKNDSPELPPRLGRTEENWLVAGFAFVGAMLLRSWNRSMQQPPDSLSHTPRASQLVGLTWHATFGTSATRI